MAIDEEMMNEIRNVHQSVKPTETLFVVDSMTGQGCCEYSKSLQRCPNYNGVVLTKLDGDTRGGAALTIRSVVENQLSSFLLVRKWMLWIFSIRKGWQTESWDGDVVSLVERAQEQFDEEEAKSYTRRLLRTNLVSTIS